MKRICMIGNSHVAAMRHGWGEISNSYPEVEADIFGSLAPNLRSAVIESDGHLRPQEGPFWCFGGQGTEPRRAKSIDVARYDAFVIIGSEFGPLCVFKTYKHYHYHGLRGRRRRALIKGLFVRAVQQLANESAASHLAATLQQGVRRPIYLVPTPFPSERGFEPGHDTIMEPWRAAVDSGDSEPLLAIYENLCEDWRKRGITLVTQPPATKASAMATRQEYSENSMRLNAAKDVLHPENDSYHMNGAYGAVMWREVIRAVQAGA